MVARTFAKAIRTWPDDQFSELVAAVLAEQAKRYEAKRKQIAGEKISRNVQANAERLRTKH